MKLKKMVLLYFLVFSWIFHGCFSASKHSQNQHQSRFGSAVFPLLGNVYPDGIYTVSMKVGKRSSPFVLDIDTGSELTWLQCDAPCARCSKAPEFQYKPFRNLVLRNEPQCVALSGKKNYQSKDADDQCDYEVSYADNGSSIGVLVRDSIPLHFTNGFNSMPQLVFGCGYDQQFGHPSDSTPIDGVLGLGQGKSSILSQLSESGITRNVLGHCLSGKGGGYLFFGDDPVPSSGIVWAPLSPNSVDTHYSLGSAELLSDGKSTGVKNLFMIFDSGSSYTYFIDKAYQATLSIINKGLIGKPLKDAFDDKTLPVCWKGKKHFKTVNDVKNMFKPFALSFTKAKNAQLQIPPEAYLIVTKYGNVCLGILNGSQVGLGNVNLIGDISLQDKMVIYDIENQRIGWVDSNCDKLPNVDRDYNELFAASPDIRTEYYDSHEEF